MRSADRPVRSVARPLGCAADQTRCAAELVKRLHGTLLPVQLTIHGEYAILLERSVPEISAGAILFSRRFKTRAKSQTSSDCNLLRMQGLTEIGSSSNLRRFP